MILVKNFVVEDWLEENVLVYKNESLEFAKSHSNERYMWLLSLDFSYWLESYLYHIIHTN